MTVPSSPPERIVVRPPNWLGDAVLALPAIAAVRLAFPSAHLTIAAPASVAAIFREDTDARPDRVLDLPGSTRAAAVTLEGEGFSHGILLPNSFRSAWQFWRARIPARWGYGTAGRGWLLTRRSRVTRAVGVRHQSDYYRDLIRGLDIPCGAEVAPRLAPTRPSAERAEALLQQHGAATGARDVLQGPLVGLAPGAAYGQAKQWPPERMAELMARLIRERDVTCLLVGASHDAPAARAIESWLRARAPDVWPRVVNLVGRTSLGALVGVVSRTSAFVANDSGAMHLAAALGRPVVALFGPTDERVTRPVGAHEVIIEPVFCRPCMLRDCPIDHRCMKRIDVDRVYLAVVARLDRLG
jgi:heptosyltransferase II